MKKLLVGLLALNSLSVFAHDLEIKCDGTPRFRDLREVKLENRTTIRLNKTIQIPTGENGDTARVLAETKDHFGDISYDKKKNKISFTLWKKISITGSSLAGESIGYSYVTLKEGNDVAFNLLDREGIKYSETELDDFGNPQTLNGPIEYNFWGCKIVKK
jgi:hypothetical protein